jgi:hypothetical protein
LFTGEPQANAESLPAVQLEQLTTFILTTAIAEPKPTSCLVAALCFTGCCKFDSSKEQKAKQTTILFPIHILIKPYTKS